MSLRKFALSAAAAASLLIATPALAATAIYALENNSGSAMLRNYDLATGMAQHGVYLQDNGNEPFANYANIAFASDDDGPVVSPVPEPATWALMIAGFGLAGVGLRRRRPALLPA